MDKNAAKNFVLDAISDTYKDALIKLLLSQLAYARLTVSLLFTHNAWFINEILPQILGTKPHIKDFEIAPSDVFDNMRFMLCMDNGSSYPSQLQPHARKSGWLDFK